VGTVNGDDDTIPVERNVPVASAEGECSTQSKRIRHKRAVSRKGNLQQRFGIEKCRCVCDVLGCGSTCNTPKGLAIHRGRCHKTNERKSLMTEESEPRFALYCYELLALVTVDF